MGLWNERNEARVGQRVAFTLWLLLAAAILTVFAPTAAGIVQVWSNSETYGHGFLIIPIVGFLVWRRRARLASVTPAPTLWGLAAMAGAGALWFVGEMAEVNALRHFGLAFMLQATVLAVFGWRFVRMLLLPLLFFLFAVPFGEFLVPPLQDLTAHYTTLLVRWSGVPIYMDDWHLVIPGGAFLVAEACSGVRYLIACTALGVLICDLMFRKPWKVAAFMALSVAVPIVANVFRAYGIVMLAHLSDFEIAVGVDHLVYGWFFLTFVTVILILIAVKMQDPPEKGSEQASTDAQHHAVSEHASGAPLRYGKVSVIALAFLAGTLAFKGYAGTLAAPQEIAAPELDPPTLASWQHDPDAVPDWRADFPGADLERTWIYEKGGEAVTVYIAYYTHERPGAELISYRNRMTDDDDASTLGRGQAEAGVAEGVPAPGVTRLHESGDSRVVWHWYWVNGRLTADPVMAKVQAFLAKTLQGEPSAAVVAVSSNAGEDAEAVLSDFLSNASPAAWLEGSRSEDASEPAVANVEEQGG